MDPDHLDIYGTAGEMNLSFNEFARNIKPGGTLIIRNGLLIDPGSEVPKITYAVDELSDLRAINLHSEKGIQLFDMISSGEHFRNVQLQVPGRHNVENALAATAICRILGVEWKAIILALGSFTGVRRRFDIRIRKPGMVYIDDYAHHPKELEAFISAVRQLYPGQKLTGLFQPHLYTRTRDFAAGFAQSLDFLDEAWLLDIYPARELPIPGITSELIFNQMVLENKMLLSKSEVMERLKTVKPGIFLTMGAGDIDLLVEPITNILNS
jgi:UDP-N-acetylmuramate--alanine ligase